MDKLEELKEILHEENASLVVCYENGEIKEYYQNRINDIKDILKKDKTSLKGAIIADKVIGKVAGSILTVAGVKEIYADVMSKYAIPVLEKNNISQLRIAETEKYAHVTYFFDGESHEKLDNCDQILIPSPKVSTYDLKSEMSAYEITNQLLEIIDNYDVIILNFANGDMVGHTGNFEATVKAVETVDECIGKLYNKIKTIEGLMLVTADHGNSDYMLDENNNIITSHSLSKVPFIVVDKNYKVKNGKLSDIAPTILNLLNIEIPKEMTGNILIEK